MKNFPSLLFAAPVIGISALLLSPLCGLAEQSKSSAMNVGQVQITWQGFMAGQGYLLYKTARMKTDNGATLDADELKVNLTKGSSGLTNVVATGHVRAHAEQVADGRSYTVTADKGVYDPKLNDIELTGNVETDVVSSYTTGPLKQTGTSATIQLGKGPDYPQITMLHGVTVFTPQQ